MLFNVGFGLRHAVDVEAAEALLEVALEGVLLRQRPLAAGLVRPKIHRVDP